MVESKGFSFYTDTCLEIDEQCLVQVSVRDPKEKCKKHHNKLRLKYSKPYVIFEILWKFCISLWTDAAIVIAESLHLELVLKTPKFTH